MNEDILIEKTRPNGNRVQKLARNNPESAQPSHIAYRELNPRGEVIRWKDPGACYEQAFGPNGEQLFYCDNIGYRVVERDNYKLTTDGEGEILDFSKTGPAAAFMSDTEKMLKKLAMMADADRFYNTTLFAAERDLEMELNDLPDDEDDE
jgi:hypothetical protein